jgi:hypothetical protein
MPGLHEQIRILPVTDDSPACGEDLLDLIGPEEHLSGVAGHAVDR